MNTRRTARSAALVAALLSAAPLATAHHGTNISYDRSKQFTAQAVVTEFQYRNPHPELHVEVKDDKGAVVKWSLELLPNPAQLIRTGWSRAKANEAIKPGTQVWSPSRPRRPEAWWACSSVSPPSTGRNWSRVAAVLAAVRRTPKPAARRYWTR